MLVIVMLLAVLSSSVHLIEGVLIKKYNEKHDKGGFIFTAIVSLFSMLFFVTKDILIDKDGFNFTLKMLPYGIIAGVFYCTASFATFVALGCGPFAISRLVLSYSGIFSILYGIIRFENKLSPFAIAGILLMFISLFLNRRQKKENEKKASLKWLICITISVIGSGMYGVIQKEQQFIFDKTVDNEFMIVGLGFSAITLFIIGFIKDGKDTLYILKNGTLYSSVAGLSNGLTNFLIIFANGLITTNFAVISPIRSGIGIILSFVVSLVIFKEKLLPRQIFGVALGTVALVLLNF